MIPIIDDHAWRKSTYSGQGGEACVEVGPGRNDVGVRDTKRPDLKGFYVSPTTWATFVRSVVERHA